MRKVLLLFLALLIINQTLMAGVARNRGGNGVALQNRSVQNNQNLNRNANVNRNANINQNANVNRNINVDQNINVNRNVDVHGGYYGGCCYYHEDNDWNWGSFAVGAAAGAVTTAAVAAATHPAETTVVTTAAVPVGTIVTMLPGGCSGISSGGTVIYNCNSIYYRPFYQGTTLVYQVVQYP